MTSNHTNIAEKLRDAKSTADTKKQSTMGKSSIQIKTPVNEKHGHKTAQIAKFQISASDSKTISESAKKSRCSTMNNTAQKSSKRGVITEQTQGFKEIMKKLETEGEEGETDLFFFQPELEQECFLPANVTPHRFTLVLDLDETLVHYEEIGEEA